MSTETNQTEQVNGPDTSMTENTVNESRRRLLGKGAAIAAVAAVAGVASSSSKIYAANGSTMIVGANNVGTATTQLGGGSTLRVTGGNSDGFASIYGVQNSTAATYGVRGDALNGGGVGVYGLASSTSIGTGVRGDGITYDLYAGASGRVFVKPTGGISPTGGGTAGTIAADSSGGLWFCTATNTWQRLAAASAAGAFTAINPVRVFDSRNAAFPTPGTFAASSSRVISVKDGRDGETGAVTLANAVPSGATAVAFNITAAATTARSFLSVAPGDAASTDASTLNWSGAGVSIANASIVKLDDSRQIKIFAGPGGSFEVILDITGYYL